MIAALYVDTNGPYFGLPGVDPWDIIRNARQYAGPHPVIAHPPCGPWGALRHMCTKQDPGCGPRAFEQVRAFGGVLEHPAGSTLFRHVLAPMPGELPDGFGGRTIEVCQCDFGHVARKRTWLYVVGGSIYFTSPPSKEPTHWVSGGRTGDKRLRGQIPEGIKACSAQQRRRTPPAFRDLLLSIARSVPRKAA
jgi:hypothetical protein